MEIVFIRAADEKKNEGVTLQLGGSAHRYIPGTIEIKTYVAMHKTENISFLYFKTAITETQDIAM